MTAPTLLAESMFLTPIWFISIGVLIGLVLVAVFVALIYFLSSVPPINGIYTNRDVFLPVLIIGTALLSGLTGYWLFINLNKDLTFRDSPGEAINATIISSLLIVPLCLMMVTGFVGMISAKRIKEVLACLSEGFLLWCNIAFGILAAFAIIGLLLGLDSSSGIVTIVDNPVQKLSSLGRLYSTGQDEIEFTLDYNPENAHVEAVPISFREIEMRRITVETDQQIRWSRQDLNSDFNMGDTYQVEPNYGEPVAFNFAPVLEDQELKAANDTEHDQLYFRNEGTGPAKVKVTWYTEPLVPQVSVIPWTAFFVFSIYVFYFAIIAGFPKVAAVANSTVKTELSQPIYMVLLLIGIIFIVASIYIPYNTFGEDNKMYKDSAITLVRVLAIFMAVWAASKSVAEEIEGRTALTVLSKPIGRKEFLMGKFVGISLAVGILVLILGLWLIIWTAYKPIYDGVESANRISNWQICFAEAVGIIPGLILAALEVTIFVALAIAISTRVSILANFLICFSIYVLGHLTPLIANSALGEFAPVAVTGQLIGTIFPVLLHFDVSAAINSESLIPMTYLWMASVYCTIYVACAMLLGFVLFEDRDLA
jgi:ABC-type transport system involved in multi-copper enzyme maturation permease subunit